METQEIPMIECPVLGQYEEAVKALEVIRANIKEESKFYRERVEEYTEVPALHFMISNSLKRVRDYQLVERVLVSVVDGWDAIDPDIDPYLVEPGV
jgi:hypothetical protein